MTWLAYALISALAAAATALLANRGVEGVPLGLPSRATSPATLLRKKYSRPTETNRPIR